MAKRRVRIGLAVAGVALVVAGGCGSDEGADTADTNDSGASTTPLEGTNWVLAGDELGEPLGDIAVSALFIEGTVAGQGGCNRYTGPYDVEGDDADHRPGDRLHADRLWSGGNRSGEGLPRSATEGGLVCDRGDGTHPLGR